jgi:hypothetical protein
MLARSDWFRTGPNIRSLPTASEDLAARGSPQDVHQQAAMELRTAPHGPISSANLIIAAREPPRRGYTVQELRATAYDIYRLRDGWLHWVHTEYEGDAPTEAQTQPLRAPSKDLPEGEALPVDPLAAAPISQGGAHATAPTLSTHQEGGGSSLPLAAGPGTHGTPLADPDASTGTASTLATGQGGSGGQQPPQTISPLRI